MKSVTTVMKSGGGHEVHSGGHVNDEYSMDAHAGVEVESTHEEVPDPVDASMGVGMVDEANDDSRELFSVLLRDEKL